jgi:probable rRNA maturation factor
LQRASPDASLAEILSAVPALELYDHQAALELDMERLFRAAADAVPLVMRAAGPGPALLEDLDEVEVSFIDDNAIAKVHAEFMNDASPTDVITFDHGEILISTEAAVRQAVQGGHSPLRECALYVIHGLLHLNGHDDQSPETFAGMKQLQEAILDEVWPLPETLTA